MTGWFGIPGSRRAKDCTDVHAVDKNERPICGVRMRKGMEFQFCADGFAENYIECGRCKRILSPIFKANMTTRRRDR